MSFGQYSQEPKPAKPSMPEKTKRLKYVFDDPTHVWANPLKKDGSGFEQDNARNSRTNIYFKTSSDGTRVLYSYRDSYPIASLFTHKKQTVVLLRSGKPYSVTTGKHFSMARNASQHIEPKYTVANVITDMRYASNDHAANIVDYVERLSEQIEAFGKARSVRNIEYAFQSAGELDAEVRAYAKRFGLKLPKLPKLPAIDAEKMATIRERERIADAKRDAKRAAEVDRWEDACAAYEDARAAEVNRWEDAGGCPHINSNTLRPIHAYYDRHTCELQTRREEWEAKKPELIAAWKSGVGKTNSLQFGYSDYAMLRVKRDDATGLHNVETSQGVSVPVAGRLGAARLLAYLYACRNANRPYKANGHTEHIGKFTVSSFAPLNYKPDSLDKPESEWILVAGCHRILWSEVQSITDAVRVANDADSARNR